MIIIRLTRDLHVNHLINTDGGAKLENVSNTEYRFIDGIAAARPHSKMEEHLTLGKNKTPSS